MIAIPTLSTHAQLVLGMLLLCGFLALRVHSSWKSYAQRYHAVFLICAGGTMTPQEKKELSKLLLIGKTLVYGLLAAAAALCLVDLVSGFLLLTIWVILVCFLKNSLLSDVSE